jgi:hypothetical protein
MRCAICDAKLIRTAIGEDLCGTCLYEIRKSLSPSLEDLIYQYNIEEFSSETQ